MAKALPRGLLPAKRLRIPGQIARDLGVKIVSGTFKPGTVLKGEIAASDQRSVSRSAYREAMRILVAKGLVESRPKMGTRVSDMASWHLLDPDVLSWIFQFEPSEKLLVALFELRRIVEPEAAALAALRRSPAHLKKMAEALEAMARHTLTTREGQRADQDFHTALLDATGNAFVVSLTSGIGAAITWTTIFKQRLQPLKRDPVPDHRHVYDAVASGNARAASAAMRELVDMAYRDITRARATPRTAKRAKAKKRAR